jgi:WD40 repeat protein
MEHSVQHTSVHRLTWALLLHVQLLLAGSDNIIRVWDAKCWSLQQHLQGHTDAVHVLVGHPYDPRLVLSAGYDGLTILWDAQAGTELQRWVHDGALPYMLQA